MLNRHPFFFPSICWLIACLLLSPAVVQGESSATWLRSVRFPAGSTGQLIVNDGYAYIFNGWTRGDGVLVFDVKDPTRPRFVSGLEGRGYLLGGGAIRGTTLYVPTWYSLMVMDITNPPHAELMRNLFFGFPKGDASQIAMDGQRLYMGGRGGGVRIIDISEPASPVVIAHDPTFGVVTNLAASQGRLLIRPRPGQAIIAQIEDTRIIERSRLNMTGPAQWIGPALYENARAGLVIHNLTDLANPVQVSRLNGLSMIDMLPNQTLLAKGKGNLLVVLDVADPLKPQVIRELRLPEGVALGNATVKGEHLYFVDTQRLSLRIFDLSGEQARELGEHLVVRNAGYLALDDQGQAMIHYAHDKRMRLFTLDMDHPEADGFTASVATSSPAAEETFRVHDVHRAAAIKRIGQYLLAGDGLTDVSDPKNPSVVKLATRPAAAIRIHGDVAYLAQGDRLTLLDVSNLPDLPVLGVYKPDAEHQNMTDVIIRDGLAYIVHNIKTHARLEVVDVSDPHKPTHVAQCPIPRSIAAALHGDYLYLPGAGMGEEPPAMAIIDLSVARAPRLAGIVDGLVDISSYAVQVRNNKLYFTDNMQGIKAADLADPLNPKLIHTYLGPTRTSAVYTDFDFHDDKLYGLRFSELDVWELVP